MPAAHVGGAGRDGEHDGGEHDPTLLPQRPPGQNDPRSAANRSEMTQRRPLVRLCG